MSEGRNWEESYLEMSREFSLRGLPVDAYAPFYAVKGREYKPGGFMVVGRCPHGWEDMGIAEQDGFSFIQGEQGTYYFGKDEKKNRLSGSSFFRVCKQAYLMWSGDSDDGSRWFEHIVWSNLIKLAPLAARNPKNAAVRAQIAPCVEVLKKELEFYQPKLVLMLTGNWWLEHEENSKPSFAKALKIKVPPNNGRRADILAKMRYNEGTLIVCNRSEGRKEKPFVEAIQEAWSS